MDKAYTQQQGFPIQMAANTLHPQAPSQGLVSDAGTLPTRLMAIRDRLGNLKTALHGHSPHGVEGKTGQSLEPPNHENVRRFVDRSHALIAEIEGELSDIEQRL